MNRTRSIRYARFRRGAAVAAGSGGNLFLSGTLLVSAMLFGAWWLVVLAILVYGSLVTWQAACPALWQRWLPADTLPLLRLPDPARMTDPLARSAIFTIAAGHAEVARLIAELPEAVRRHVDFTVETLEELEWCAARLAERSEQMVRYLQGVRRDAVQSEVRRLGEIVRCARDPGSRREYQAALALRLEQLQAVDDITRAHERVSASLLRVVVTVETLPARLMRLCVLEAEAREDLAGELNDEMGRMQGELLASEQALRALSPSSPATGLPIQEEDEETAQIYAAPGACAGCSGAPFPPSDDLTCARCRMPLHVISPTGRP